MVVDYLASQSPATPFILLAAVLLVVMVGFVFVFFSSAIATWKSYKNKDDPNRKSNFTVFGILVAIVLFYLVTFIIQKIA